MKNFTKPRWCPEQTGLLRNLLINEELLDVNDVAERVGRSRSSVVREAQHMDYGVKTKDGVLYFYKGIKRKQKVHTEDKKKEIVGTGSETTGNSITYSTLDRFDDKSDKSISFISKDALHINSRAIDILSENSLVLDAKSIYEVSLLVSRSQKSSSVIAVSGSSSDPWLNNDCKVTEG